MPSIGSLLLVQEEKILLLTLLRILLLIIMILAAQQTPWPGGPDLQAAVPFAALLALVVGTLVGLRVSQWRHLPKPLLILLALAGVSALASPVPWVAFPAFLEKTLWIAATILAVSLFSQRGARTPLVAGVVLLSLQQILMGTHQYLSTRAEVWGSLGTPNALARFVLMAWPLVVACIPLARNRVERSLLISNAVGLCVVLLLTSSRMALLALVAEAAYLFGTTRSRIGISFLIVIGALTSLVLVTGIIDPAFRGDDLQRLLAWRTATDLALKYPLLGMGLGTFGLYYSLLPPPGAVQILATPHSLWLHLACELGLLSLPVFLWFVVSGWKKLCSLEWRSTDQFDKALLLAARAVILGLGVQSLVEY